MAVFAIGDLHLSLGGDKAMDAFPGWKNYVTLLETNWREQIAPEDTVLLCGDTSWGMTLEESRADFAFLQALPGRKILLKGNHDYWWTSASRMSRFFEENGFSSLEILHNNFISAEGLALCGTRGWMMESGKPHDDKLINREVLRLEASLTAAKGFSGEKVVFLHYPPIYNNQFIGSLLEVLARHCIARCYYGHIHGGGHRFAHEGLFDGVEYTMISADYLHFCPKKL
ncbi:metallophosphoesterase [Oscillospiraceae bacterium MB08-C2-2]|nr:metallophosphoesterase [Oscillospiraceae bacterium MB08-C2-2]